MRSIDLAHPVAGNLLQDFPHRERLLVSLLNTTGCGTLLGVLVASCWRRYWLHSPRICLELTLATFAFYPALACLQFTVQSTHPYVLFLITGLAGVAAGVLLAALGQLVKFLVLA